MFDDADPVMILGRIRNVVSSFLNKYVSTPALETITKDIVGQNRIANANALILIIIDEIRKNGRTFDSDYLLSLEQQDIEQRIQAFRRFLELHDMANHEQAVVLDDVQRYLIEDSSNAFLVEYFRRELLWITVSLLSASYISSFVLMRASFELTVCIATRSTKRMSDRIASISALGDAEKERTKEQWYRLCAWGHPYGKWIQVVCPTFLQHKPMYHPTLFAACTKELLNLVDFFIVVVTYKYQLDYRRLVIMLKESNIDLSDYEMFRSKYMA